MKPLDLGIGVRSDHVNDPRIVTKRDVGMDKSLVKLAPSILSADFAHLGQQVAEAEQAGSDRIHIDVGVCAR